MTFKLPELPYAKDALVPYMSAETFDFHYGKHHAAYVGKLGELIPGTAYEGKPLEEICASSFNAGDAAVFNNAAQHWNHSFFWKCMTPNGGGISIPGALETKINEDLGGYEQFKNAFIDACLTQFGSGWAWLAMDNQTGKLEILKTPNAETPFTSGKTALLTCDVWEHAYYIDHRNARPKYAEAFVDNLINWEFAAELLEKGPLKIAA